MKTIAKIMILFAGWMVFLLSACSPDNYELSAPLSKEALKFSVTQNPNDPNMVILESLTPGVIPAWNTPQGRSTRVKDTLKIPFAGNYTFTYGATSNGGYVEADPYSLNITTNNFTYITDELWTLLTGGVGQQKTWYLDLNASGVSKFFKGALYFYGTNDSWESVTEGIAVGGDSWNWQADWPGNQYLMAAADFGSMTFSLIDGPKVTVVHKSIPKRGTENGTYMLDPDAHTLKLSNASPLHDVGRDNNVINWGDLKVLSLTENTMQLAALRDPVLSGEGACLLVYNFVSKDYYDSH